MPVFEGENRQRTKWRLIRTSIQHILYFHNNILYDDTPNYYIHMHIISVNKRRDIACLRDTEIGKLSELNRPNRSTKTPTLLSPSS